ncbi:hypothetical protein IVA96_23950 [Bradyrhizobium sp. 159]|uniref:hypothetical protein n=1 Tax=Bradyrhizobium sp. 159 TaxID=2782632 RepID=UPI001FF8CF91|nr:hypothetical protein [Bradyrhizobium sp. 159]MCK1619573.1 hypothetical protein [Bradyrhizobium sp. 159]
MIASKQRRALTMCALADGHQQHLSVDEAVAPTHDQRHHAVLPQCAIRLYRYGANGHLVDPSKTDALANEALSTPDRLGMNVIAAPLLVFRQRPT